MIKLFRHTPHSRTVVRRTKMTRVGWQVGRCIFNCRWFFIINVVRIWGGEDV